MLCDELYHSIRIYRYRSSTTLSRPAWTWQNTAIFATAIEERDRALAMMRRCISGARINI